MSDERRRQAVLDAYEMIVRDGHAVCVCGQMFLSEDGYADHVETCKHVARAGASRG